MANPNLTVKVEMTLDPESKAQLDALEDRLERLLDMVQRLGESNVYNVWPRAVVEEDLEEPLDDGRD